MVFTGTFAIPNSYIVIREKGEVYKALRTFFGKQEATVFSRDAEKIVEMNSAIFLIVSLMSGF